MTNIQQELTISKSIVLECGCQYDIWMGNPIGWIVGTFMVEKKTFCYEKKRENNTNDYNVILALIIQSIPIQDVVYIIFLNAKSIFMFRIMELYIKIFGCKTWILVKRRDISNVVHLNLVYSKI